MHPTGVAENRTVADQILELLDGSVIGVLAGRVDGVFILRVTALCRMIMNAEAPRLNRTVHLTDRDVANDTSS